MSPSSLVPSTVNVLTETENNLTLCLFSGWFQYAKPTEGIPAGLAAPGLPAVPGGSGQHPPSHTGCPGTQCVPIPVSSSSTHAGNSLT